MASQQMFINGAIALMAATIVALILAVSIVATQKSLSEASLAEKISAEKALDLKLAAECRANVRETLAETFKSLPLKALITTESNFVAEATRCLEFFDNITQVLNSVLITDSDDETAKSAKAEKLTDFQRSFRIDLAFRKDMLFKSAAKADEQFSETHAESDNNILRKLTELQDALQWRLKLLKNKGCSADVGFILQELNDRVSPQQMQTFLEDVAATKKAVVSSYEAALNLSVVLPNQVLPLHFPENETEQKRLTGELYDHYKNMRRVINGLGESTLYKKAPWLHSIFYAGREEVQNTVSD